MEGVQIAEPETSAPAPEEHELEKKTSRTKAAPETSKQIAKRMRELHDGVELLEEEKDAGPNVWSNWDRWLDQVEKTMLFLDQRVLSGTVGPSRGPGDSWKSCGLICGVQWAEFKAMVEKYRNFLGQHYGESRALREQLVFAHNDTQYGNILRVRPNDQRSPLLQPANEHKQLIVIDFEYAAANVPGLEFVNHFSEWTYDYHHPTAPWSCDVTRYPTVEEQRRFIKAYVDHRPRLSYSSQPETGTDTTTGLPPLETPPTSALGGEGGMLLRSTSPTNSIREFMLDGRMPPDAYREEERRREEDSERRIAELMQETKLWRVANSAQWVAWGIVQAKVPGLAEVKEDEGEEEAASDEFDYLAYAHERATFFWGDCVLMGLVKLEDLPDSLRERIKLVEY
ncbi:hypothetical protein P8C59_009261 [Phyllachora maydis]|uniref:Choline kinase n=1 Tax=Phyllachora maydis TaxID=1825666 RepID=A0AAD9MJI0_9PEZI|nr:hypothetical protein P8C59_009261 [Phyllachora maydis]